MRWSMNLDFPSLVAESQPPGRDLSALEQAPPSLEMGPDSYGRSARAWISVCGDALEIAVLAESAKVRDKRPEHEEWYLRDHTVVFLNPGHDHATRWGFVVEDTGKVIGSANWTLPGEEVGDNASAKLPGPPQAMGAFRKLDDQSFFSRTIIPTAGLWKDESSPVGLLIKVGYHDELIVPAVQWPDASEQAGDPALFFGDLYRQEPVIKVVGMEVPEPAWGGEPSEIDLEIERADGAPSEGHVKVRTILPGDSEEEQAGSAWKTDGESTNVRVPILFSHRAKWANDTKLVARFRLTLVGGDGKPLWAAEFPFGFDTGIIVRERYGPQGKPLPLRPEPSDPEFVDKFRAYVLARIPDYRPRTTREGAPSDFYLEDPSGEASLDMSAADSLDQVAKFIARRFPDWQDAVCAIAVWIYNPFVTRHSGSWARISGMCTVDSIPRVGGCFCGDTGRLGGALAERVGALLGVQLKAYHLGLRGHICTLLESPIGRVVIDGMHGVFYHTLDNTRLATLEELREEKEIAERMWYCPRAHGHEFFYKVYVQEIRTLRLGQLRWPTANWGE